MPDAPGPSQAAPIPPRRKPYRLLRRLAFAAAIIAAWYLITTWRIEVAYRKPLILPVVWTAGSSEPPPKDFRFVLFPPAGGVTLWDKPHGAAIGTVLRAVTGSLHEQGLEFVPVTDGSVSGFVKQAELRWSAPPSEAGPMIDAMIRERRARGPEYRGFKLAATLPEGAQGEATVEMTVDGSTSRSIYTLDGKGVHPVQFECATRTQIGVDPAVGTTVIVRFLLFFPAAALALYIIRRR